MAYLLDSHALLWFLEGSASLSAGVKAIIEADAVPIFVSPASIYELRYKAALKKLRPLPAELRAVIEQAGFVELPITMIAAEAAAHLPQVLRDPWDRMLAAQAITSGYVLMSSDRNIEKLGVQTIW
ncbi:MAG: type II toxin-antitoxin system VapC family toxin [Parvularculaceae bacterium]